MAVCGEPMFFGGFRFLFACSFFLGAGNCYFGARVGLVFFLVSMGFILVLCEWTILQ